MTEEEQKQQQPIIQDAEQYAEAIKNLKEKTVSKEEYDRVVAEKSTLVKALAGEGPVPKDVQEQAKPADIKDLRKKFLDAGEENLSNAEYIKTALELRKAAIAEGELDPFIPSGAKVKPTPQDVAKAQEVADTMQKWLDDATDENGKIDEELFMAYMRKGIAEDSPVIAARLRASKARR